MNDVQDAFVRGDWESATSLGNFVTPLHILLVIFFYNGKSRAYGAVEAALAVKL